MSCRSVVHSSLEMATLIKFIALKRLLLSREAALGRERPFVSDRYLPIADVQIPKLGSFNMTHPLILRSPASGQNQTPATDRQGTRSSPS